MIVKRRILFIFREESSAVIKPFGDVLEAVMQLLTDYQDEYSF